MSSKRSSQRTKRGALSKEQWDEYCGSRRKTARNKKQLALHLHSKSSDSRLKSALNSALLERAKRNS
jgi:hypothetical protein